MKLFEKLDILFRNRLLFSDLFSELKEGSSVEGCVKDGESFVFKKLKQGFFVGPGSIENPDISFSVNTTSMEKFLESEFNNFEDIKAFIESDIITSDFDFILNAGIIKLTQKGYFSLLKKLDYSVSDLMKKSLKYIGGNGRKLWQKKMF